MGSVKTYEISKGINIRLFKTDKFKTNNISFNIYLPLKRDTVTKAALLPRVLKRGTEKYKSLKELSIRTEELYGASVALGIVKKGDSQIIKANITYISDSFLSEKITPDVVDLLKQLVIFPKIEDDGFDKEWVRQEKENLKNFIEGLINDKKEYAQVKCDENMFSDDPYGLFEYGYVEDLKEIDEKNLYLFYKEILKNSVIDIWVGGSFKDDEIIEELKNAFASLGDRNSEYTKTNLAKIEENIEVKRIVEKVPTTQSKLVMGFNAGVNPVNQEYYQMMLFSCIFGGSPFSKLFNNVREKLSLAYYVFSSYDRQKSYMKISAGIEADKFDAAYDEIMVQLKKMQTGDFTEEEISSAKKYIETSLTSCMDSMSATENFYLGQIMLENGESIKDLIENVKKVSKDEIKEAANRVQQDTIYFLKGVGLGEV